MLVRSPTQMLELGAQLGAKLIPGDLLILSGPLGAGKTALTKGIAQALGITELTSPTFVIAKECAGAIPLIHVDAYRLITSEKSRIEFEDLDLEARRDKSITVIEWGSELGIRPDEQYLEIEIAFGQGEDDRLLTLLPHGARWDGFSL